MQVFSKKEMEVASGCTISNQSWRNLPKWYESPRCTSFSRKALQDSKSTHTHIICNLQKVLVLVAVVVTAVVGGRQLGKLPTVSSEPNRSPRSLHHELFAL